jgi:hypothetical protein
MIGLAPGANRFHVKNQVIATIAFAVSAFAVIGPAHAQVPPQAPPVMQGQPIQAPGYPQACPQRVTPSAQELYQRYMRRFAPLGLAPGQQQRIQSLVDGFSRTHPAGTPLDPAAMHQLRDEVRGVLTPQQLAMLEQEHRGGSGAGHPCR